MNGPQLWFDKQGQPLDGENAERLLEDMEYVRVANSEVMVGSDPQQSCRVSTVWLGLNRDWEGGTPILFETMTFGGGERWDYRRWFWTTENAAVAGHDTVVALVIANEPEEEEGY
jgi:hypothetical protein